MLDETRPHAVINAAGYTDVNRAETDRAECDRLNVHAVAGLAEECRQAGARLVHISTDYVFGADKLRDTPYQESDTPGPQGYYAKSKLAGEEAALREPSSLVIRTCGLYDAPARVGAARNFANSILGVALRGDELRIVDDQRCTPSFVPDVAEMILRLIAANASGVYHGVNQGHATWYDFGKFLVEAAGLSNRVTPVPSSEYPSTTERPAYSVLSTEKYERTTGHTPRHWRKAISEYLHHAAPSKPNTRVEHHASSQKQNSVPLESR